MILVLRRRLIGLLRSRVRRRLMFVIRLVIRSRLVVILRVRMILIVSMLCVFILFRLCRLRSVFFVSRYIERYGH